MSPPTSSKDPRNRFAHKRNISLQKLISASTMMAPTHDRVVGMDPDEVKTPISAARRISSEFPRPLPTQRSGTMGAERPKDIEATQKIEKPDHEAGTGEGDEEDKPTALPGYMPGVSGFEAPVTAGLPGANDADSPAPLSPYSGSGSRDEHRSSSSGNAENKLEHDRKSIGHRIGTMMRNPKPPKSPKQGTYWELSEVMQKHLRKLFAELCDGEKGLDKQRLEFFLHNEQHQYVQIPHFEPIDDGNGGVTERPWIYEEWLAFMVRSGALDGVRAVGKAGVVRHDKVVPRHGLPVEEKDEELSEVDPWSHPITSYFIDSSHNTYLFGNQLTGPVDVRTYEYVLKKGCRCIEIDVHDGRAVLSDTSSNVSGSIFRPTLPSEVALIGKDKVGDVKDWGKEKKDKLKSFWKEKVKGHKRNGSSNSDVPTIRREPTSDSDDSPKEVMSDEGSAVDLSEVGIPGDNKDSRSSSKSSAHSVSLHHSRTGEPIVMHGWTPTTGWIYFRDVCKTVAKWAFKTTELPLIVSLEVGCDVDQQELMVKIMKEEWKDYLLDTAHPLCDSEKVLPTLDQLLKKILVKVKRHIPPEEAAQNAAEENAAVAANSSADRSSTDVSSPTASTLSLAPSADVVPGKTNSTASLTPTASVQLSLTVSSSNLTSIDTTGSKVSTGRPRSTSGASTPANAKPAKICKNLSDLGIYTHSAHFNKEEPVKALSAEDAPSHIYSINEDDLLDIYKKHSEHVLMHNERFFMRAYPKGTRVDSSNMDPSIYWRKGVQMVAVNWQKWDEGTMVNRGMFEGSGGWVLKPPSYRPGATMAAREGPASSDTLQPTSPGLQSPRSPGLISDTASIASKDGRSLASSTGATFLASPASPNFTRSRGSSNASSRGEGQPIGLDLGLEMPGTTLPTTDEPTPRPLPRATPLDPPVSRKPSTKIKSPRQSGSLVPTPSYGATPKPAPITVVSKPGGKQKTTDLFIRVFAAQNLLAPSDIKGRVKIEFHAERQDKIGGDDWKRETKTAKKCITPDWDGDEPIEFMGAGPGIVDELSFIRLKVEDDGWGGNDKMVAWRAVRLDRLRNGYRFLRLWTHKGGPHGGLLLVHVDRVDRYEEKK